MLQNDSPNSPEPYNWETDENIAEWASREELSSEWSRNFDEGFCSIFGIVAPDFEC